MRICIYGLIDPRTGAPFYVGLTSGDPERRLRFHISAALRRKGNQTNAPRHVRLREMIASDIRPMITILHDEDVSEKDWATKSNSLERHWIRRLHANGAPLVNVTHAKIGPFSHHYADDDIYTEADVAAMVDRKPGRPWPKANDKAGE